MIVAAEAAKQGATVGEGTVSGLMIFADDFGERSETHRAMQKHIGKEPL